MNNDPDIGHPLVWLFGWLLIGSFATMMVYIFFDVLKTLVSVATHCRSCG